MRYALQVEYAGFAFCGFQSQPSRCGVQDALERATAAIAGHPVRIVAAGRTDAGVHAVSQIVHFDTTVERPLSAWVRGVNAHLPDAAAVLWAHAVADDFHARFAATARHYTYVLLNRPERPGLWSGRVGWYHRPLDVDAMREAAQLLVGTHDFSSFRAAECQAKSPVKTLSRIGVDRGGGMHPFRFFRQCVPASHGAQRRGRAGRDRRGRAVARMDGDAARGARPDARRADVRRGGTLSRRCRLRFALRPAAHRAHRGGGHRLKGGAQPRVGFDTGGNT